MPLLLRWIVDITPCTPLCVLCVLSRHRGLVGKDGCELTPEQISCIPFSTLKKNLESIQPIHIADTPEVWTDREWRYVSRFVNPRERWKKGSLFEGYQNICKCDQMKSC